MPNPQLSNDFDSSRSALAGTVSACSTLRVDEHVDGPTLYDREPAFRRGVASADRAPTCYGRSNVAFSRARSALLFSVICLTALVAAGCGGASGDTPIAGTETPVEPVAAPLVSQTTGSDSSGPHEVNIGDPLQTSDKTPANFKAVLGKKPILIVFYQPKSKLGELLVKETTTAAKSVPGVKVFLFAAGDYKGYGDLPEALGMYSAPGVTIVDRGGKVQNFWNQYIDGALVRRSLQLAARAEPSTDSAAGESDAADTATTVGNASAPGTAPGTVPVTPAPGAATPTPAPATPVA